MELTDSLISQIVNALEKTDVFGFVRKWMTKNAVDEQEQHPLRGHLDNAPSPPKYHNENERSPLMDTLDARLEALEIAAGNDPNGVLSGEAVKLALKNGTTFDEELEHVRLKKHRYQLSKTPDPPRRDRYVDMRGDLGESVKYHADSGLYSSGDEKRTERAVERALRQRITFQEAMKLDALGIS